ncbi:MAG: hypothetical protein Q9166_005527 [cf. Caloplaca sp. 2 TL-2023]
MYKLSLLLLCSVLCALPSYAADSFLPGPFSTDGRWMTNADEDHLTYAGVNWPGSVDTMVPEGLQYASIADLVGKIKSIGMNVIRLTWAVEMVDDIIDGGGDKDIKSAFIEVLGHKNGTQVFDAVIKNNPSFSSNITRLQVFDAIADECTKQQVYIHLDNHVSKAGWCCDKDDGNAWFGDKFFDMTKWKRALGYMADHGKSWPNLMSMALRNELRQPSNWRFATNVNWNTWYGNMTAGADAIHKANPDLLIFFSGLGYDSQLRQIFSDDVVGKDISFDKSKLPYKDKIVLEVHDYDMDESNCTRREAKLTRNAFAALGPISPQVKTVFPLVMSEWGFAQQPGQYQAPYASCLRNFLPEQKVGWMTWALGGSYYIRSGVQDMDEPWGLLDHTWKDWRCAECIDKGLAPMVNATLGR